MNEVSKVGGDASPFGVALAQSHDTAATAVAEYARAQVESRAIIAIKRPRDMDAVRAKILRECQRPGFAAVARYVKPIGPDRTKWPSGPSVRFAEAAIRCMGNLQVETMVKFDSPHQRIVSVSVVDLETNVPYAQDVPITKTIERRKKKDGDTVLGTRTNTYGDTVYILQGTDDDILNKQAALVSKALRTIALRLLPGDILDEAMDQVMVTQRTEDAVDPGAARAKLFDAFGALGITPEQVKAYIGGDAVTLSPKEMTDLRSLYSALKDGETTWREVMDSREASSGGAKDGTKGGGAAEAEPAKVRAGDVIAERRAKRAKDTAQAAPAPAPAAGSEPQTDGVMGFAEFAKLIETAPDADAAALVLDQSRGAVTEVEQSQLVGVYELKWSGMSRIALCGD